MTATLQRWQDKVEQQLCVAIFDWASQRGCNTFCTFFAPACTRLGCQDLLGWQHRAGSLATSV